MTLVARHLSENVKIKAGSFNWQKLFVGAHFECCFGRHGGEPHRRPRTDLADWATVTRFYFKVKELRGYLKI